MRLNELRFTAETAPFGGLICAMSGARLLGTEIYTYQRLAPENEYGQLWAGVDGRGCLAAALLDTGYSRSLLTPGSGAVGCTAADAARLFGALPPADRFLVMTKRTNAAGEADAASFSGVEPLTGAALWDMFTLMYNRPPTDAEEKRCVFRLRAANAGLMNAFGTVDANGGLCAAAQIMAKNRRYALIGNLYTRADCRGRGCAARLLAACEAQAAAEGLQSVLYCRPSMMRYYYKHGYRTVKRYEL